MRLVMPFGRPFAALEEALCAAGCRIDRVWTGQAADALVVDFCEAVRAPARAWRWRRVAGGRLPLVAIARDAPWHRGIRPRRLWLAELFKPFDIYATHSLQGATRFGRSVLYFPNAARTSRYHLGELSLADLRDPARYRHPVSFIGNLAAERYPEHRRRVEFFAALREQLAREGIALALFDSSAGMPEAEQRAIIQSSWINLNHGAACDQGAERSWGLPERCYGVQACGGFLLSDARRHARDDFEPDREWVDYDDLAGCLAHIRRFIAEPQAARAIAEAAHARVMACHTYDHRARTLLAAIDDWYARRGTRPVREGGGERCSGS